MRTEPIGEAHASLLRALADVRNADGGWPYYRGRESRLEPTAWAVLASATPMNRTPVPSWQRQDGLLVEPSTGTPNYAFNAVAALAASANASVPDAVTAGVLAGLMGVRGVAAENNPTSRQDNSLQGWPWIAGTFSWVEPTAWSMLALKRWRSDRDASDRVRVGEQLLRNRACEGGGWNYGNAEMLGTVLPAHVPPTAVGVLAMQDAPTDAAVKAAATYLESHAAAEGSTTTLALALLALSSLRRPVSAITSALVAHAPKAVKFGNAAAIAMAACALRVSSSPNGANPLALPKGRAA